MCVHVYVCISHDCLCVAIGSRVSNCGSTTAADLSPTAVDIHGTLYMFLIPLHMTSISCTHIEEGN